MQAEVQTYPEQCKYIFFLMIFRNGFKWLNISYFRSSNRRLFSIIHKTVWNTSYLFKKDLKIPKGQSKAVNTKKDRQYNGQKKKDKMKTMMYKTLHRKLKIEQHECERRFSGRVNSSCSTSDSCYKPRDFKLVRFLTSIFYRTMLAFAHFFTCSNKHSTSSNHKDKYEFQVRSRFLTDPRV